MSYRKGEDTRALILEGSKRLFLENGYQKTTYKMIERALNINQNLITYYFKDKKTLAQTVLLDFFEAEYSYMESRFFSMAGNTPMLNYAIQNRVHYQIFADNPNILSFYTDVIFAGFLIEVFSKIEGVAKMYDGLFSYYKLPKIYPDSYYFSLETGSEYEIIHYFQPELVHDDLFIQFIVSVFPTFIGISSDEIQNALARSKKMCETLDMTGFEF